HPLLDDVLERHIASEHDDKDTALVIEEVGTAASAIRADRTPPEPIRALEEVVDLGAASSTGDAVEAAVSAAAAADRARRIRVAKVLAARTESWEDELRQQLTDLVREAVRSEVAASRQRGNEIWTSSRVAGAQARPGPRIWICRTVRCQ